MQFQTPKKQQRADYEQPNEHLYLKNHAFLLDVKKRVAQIDQVLVKTNLLALNLLNSSSIPQQKQLVCFHLIGQSVNQLQAQLDILQTDSPLVNNYHENPLKIQQMHENPHDYFCDPSPGVQSIYPYQKSEDSLFLQKKNKLVIQPQQEPLLSKYMESLNEEEIEQFQQIVSLIQTEKKESKHMKQVKKLHEIFRKLFVVKNKFLALLKLEKCQEEIIRADIIENIRIQSQQRQSGQNYTLRDQNKSKTIKKTVQQKNEKQRKQFLKRFSDKEKDHYACRYLQKPNEPKFLEFMGRIGISQRKLQSWVKKHQIKKSHLQLVYLIKNAHQEKIANQKENLQEIFGPGELAAQKINYVEFKNLVKKVFIKKNFGCSRNWFISFVNKHNLSEICNIQPQIGKQMEIKKEIQRLEQAIKSSQKEKKNDEVENE